jgi:hypothetical protein
VGSWRILIHADLGINRDTISKKEIKVKRARGKDEALNSNPSATKKLPPCSS